MNQQQQPPRQAAQADGWREWVLFVACTVTGLLLLTGGAWKLYTSEHVSASLVAIGAGGGFVVLALLLPRVTSFKLGGAEVQLEKRIAETEVKMEAVRNVFRVLAEPAVRSAAYRGLAWGPSANVLLQIYQEANAMAKLLSLMGEEPDRLDALLRPISERISGQVFGWVTSKACKVNDDTLQARHDDLVAAGRADYFEAGLKRLKTQHDQVRQAAVDGMTNANLWKLNAAIREVVGLSEELGIQQAVWLREFEKHWLSDVSVLIKEHRLPELDWWQPVLFAASEDKDLPTLTA